MLKPKHVLNSKLQQQEELPEMLRKILENRLIDIYEAKLHMQYQEGLAYVISNTKYTAQIELLEEILSDKLHF